MLKEEVLCQQVVCVQQVLSTRALMILGGLPASVMHLPASHAWEGVTAHTLVGLVISLHSYQNHGVHEVPALHGLNI